MYLWVKAFHIIFVISWFAGIFYLPRLFVHHAMSDDTATQQRLSYHGRQTLPLCHTHCFFERIFWPHYGLFKLALF